MTTILTLSLIAIAVAYCNHKYTKLMKTHNEALNSYYQNKMIEEAKKHKAIGIALTVIALLIIMAQLFNLLERKMAYRENEISTNIHYDARN